MSGNRKQLASILPKALKRFRLRFDTHWLQSKRSIMRKQMLHSKRHQPHASGNIAAYIVAPGQLSPAPCIVREISHFGAKLQVDSCWISPRVFWLRLNGNVCLHHCLFLWRAGEFVGVDFSPQH
jgi:hypothetical protein